MVVLVPYDGSSPAQKAVKHAIDTTDDEEIVLLRVIEMASGSIEAGVDLLKERLKGTADAEFPDLSEDMKATLDSSDVEFRMETAVGKPAREIVAFAEDHDVDHIVIGSHGRTGPSRVLLGSVAEQVVRRSPTTVTVVR
ncbi:MAG: universal stress protein [Halobacteriota archaeon]